MEERLKFGIFIVAYNAITTLTKVLDRIPQDVWERVEEVFVFDDCSQDETTLLAKGYKHFKNRDKLNIYRNEANLGYGGNQKKGYKYAIEKGYDYVILLHGDGQYAPESLSDFIKTAEKEKPAMVCGSRMLNKRSALKGGMPYYKFLGNIILTTYQNIMLNTKISEFHSGYRMYKTEVLKKLNLDKYTDNFHFDTEIMVELIHRSEKIVEIPIPTYYGGEICYVNGLKYAFNVFLSVLRYKLWSLGFVSCDWVDPRSKTKYAPKKSPLSSHKRVEMFVPQNSEILDLGAEGNYVDELKRKNCSITGITLSEIPEEAKKKYDEFFLEDLEKNDWRKRIEGKKYDVIILADIIEHLREPRPLLSFLKDFLKQDGIVIASTPNIAHFYVRLALLFGFFPYGSRGILDETHLHFYTLRSFKKLFEREGYKLIKKRYTPIPFELFAGKNKISRVVALFLEYFYYLFVKIVPSLFAYQMIYLFKRNN
ncbi:MAG: bifunctional glycosyltransferase/class I SAM-dependent methyltransferase [Acidobacteriota bacterium]